MSCSSWADPALLCTHPQDLCILRMDSWYWFIETFRYVNCLSVACGKRADSSASFQLNTLFIMNNSRTWARSYWYLLSLKVQMVKGKVNLDLNLRVYSLIYMYNIKDENVIINNYRTSHTHIKYFRKKIKFLLNRGLPVKLISKFLVIFYYNHLQNLFSKNCKIKESWASPDNLDACFCETFKC